MRTLPITKLGESVNVDGVDFHKIAPNPDYGLGEGVFFAAESAEFLFAPWGKSEPAELWVGNHPGLWLFMRGTDQRSNPEWRSIRKIEFRPFGVSKSDTNDRVYTMAWRHFWLGEPLRFVGP